MGTGNAYDSLGKAIEALNPFDVAIQLILGVDAMIHAGNKGA